MTRYMFKPISHINYNKHYSLGSQIIRITLSMIFLLIGGLIYVAYRDQSLVMFNWFNIIGLSEPVDYLRGLVQGEGIYGWVKYSLPDGLWLFSYMFIIDAIWNGKRNAYSTLFIWGLPIVALLSECLQYFGLCPGVFDWMDLASYVLAIVLYIIVKLIK